MLIELESFLLLALFITITRLIFSKDTKKDVDKHEEIYKNYPSGTELIKELNCISIIQHDKYKLDYYLIDPYIFREYVYKYEMVSGLSREVSLKRALDEYLSKYNI